MSEAPVHFLSWLRVGLAAGIRQRAVDGLAPTASATAPVSVTVAGVGEGGDIEERVVPERTVKLYGPGDVVGLDARQVLRREPVPGAADFEPNYFCMVELAPPDLPWRYTPARPDAAGRLQPWLALVVVEEREGVWLEERGDRLAVLHVDEAARELPPPADLWAWAHVQVQHDLPDGVPAALDADPGAFRSRLVCPRRLKPNRGWLACVVPTFEAGRRAGIDSPGLDVAGPAWGSGPADLPVYLSWRFRTGPSGDFESLVKKLRPRELPPDVGLRDLDVSEPGGGLPAQQGAVVSFQGALVSPSAEPKKLRPRHRKALRAGLADAVNASATRGDTGDGYDPRRDDPVVAPSRYGRAQLRDAPVPEPGQAPVWYGALNTLPQHRGVAGLGSDVVRRDQEAMMDAAWDAARELRSVNRRLAASRLALEVSTKQAARVKALDDARLLQHASGALARMAGDGGTAAARLRRSALPDGLVVGAFRRAARARGPALAPDAAAVVTRTFLADPLGPVGAYRNVVAPAGADTGTAGEDETAAAAPASVTRKVGAQRQPATATGPAVKKIVAKPVDATVAVTARASLASPPQRTVQLARPDVAARATVKYTAPVDLDVVASVRTAIDPRAVISAAVRAQITAPDTSWDEDVPARMWAGPRFETPMYTRVREMSVEYLVPGIGLVPDETLGVLLTNDAYVEALLVGVNHELGREFLWREYPARLTGTWCRRFWNGIGDDIPAISAWRRRVGLGRQDRSAQAQTVLLIKGTFPRRYPDVRVYAVEAEWVDGGTRREDKEGDVQTPIFSGELEPGTLFYGFDLDVPSARGSTDRGEHPGYFFVLEEQPKGPRFGLDVGGEGQVGEAPRRWSDVSWGHVTATGSAAPAAFVDLGATPWLAAAGELAGNGGRDAWAADAASMARITLQRPMRLLVHADSMLPEPADG